MNTSLALLVPLGLTATIWADDSRPAPQPRLKIDPVSQRVVIQPAPETTTSTPAADTLSTPVVMTPYYVRGRSAVPREAPKQETYEGHFSLTKGGEIWRNSPASKVDVAVGFWPALQFIKIGSTSYREGGPRLDVDFLRIKW